MSDWAPIVYRLGKIDPLPNSDFLEITTVLGEYPVILKKGQYKEGQLVSFIPYDTVVPDIDIFYFLAPPVKKNSNGDIITPSPPIGHVPQSRRTIKAKRIRDTYSEGIIVDAPPGFNEGDSIIDFFGLKKRIYEEELPEKGIQNNESNPKTFNLSKYDLEGFAHYRYAFENGEDVLITEKIEGENCSFTYAEDRLWVKSRNFFKKNEEGSHWYDVPNRLCIEEKLKEFPMLAVYVELYGGIKGWKYDCQVINGRIQRKVRIFDIFDINKKQFLEWNKITEIAEKLDIETVPILFHGKWNNDRTLHELAEGNSTIGSCVKEGWVMRSIPEQYHSRLGRKIVKLKGRDYKLIKG